jgi:broad specificity phosphatase PhoE
MKTYLILVKHSLPEIQESSPAREWELSEEGRLRAGRLAERLIQYQPQVIISSKESKAVQTAGILSGKFNVKPQSVDGLHEHDRSSTPYLSRDDFENSVREFFANPDQLVFGNETANEAYQRFAQAVYSILESFPHKTIVVVAHGTVISLFVSRLTGMSDLSLWQELGLPSFLVMDMQSNTLLETENIA